MAQHGEAPDVAAQGRRESEARGADLRVGDTLATWFGRQTVVALDRVTGFGERIADFASGYAMAIEGDARYEVVYRAAGAA